MKRKIVLFSWAVAVCTLIFFIGYSRASLATGLFRSPDREMKENASDTAAGDRVRTYGKQFASWLNGNVPGGMVPSAAVGVIQGDELVFHHGVRADLDTRFGIASLSKTFTAVLALRLHEKELMDLDEPVSKYLPGAFIERAELQSVPVTVRHLLAHTSGIPSSGSNHRVFRYGERSVSAPAQVHPAGYCYSYSNEGYELMMLVIEAATGKSYAQNMQEQVLGPLGMTASTAEFSNGTGGIVTTIRDLAKYTAMLLNRGRYRGKVILGEESLRADARQAGRAAGAPRSITTTRSAGRSSPSAARSTATTRRGAGSGQASGLQAFPARNIAFIYLCNPPEHLGDSFMSWRQGLTGMLRFLVRKISGDEKLCTEWPSLTPGELKWYEGSYRNVITGETVQVSLKSGTLFSNGFGGFMPLRTFTSNRFLIDSGRMLHNFVWKDNRVVGLALRHGYYELVRP